MDVVLSICNALLGSLSLTVQFRNPLKHTIFLSLCVPVFFQRRGKRLKVVSEFPSWHADSKSFCTWSWQQGTYLFFFFFKTVWVVCQSETKLEKEHCYVTFIAFNFLDATRLCRLSLVGGDLSILYKLFHSDWNLKLN